MVLVPIVVLWALAAADQLPVTITASIGDDACLPCSTHPWGHLRGVILSCTHHNGTHHPIPVLRHRLGWLPPEPGWSPSEEPDNRFGGRVSFCAGGPGEAGLALLLRNLSDPDFGNYSCYVAGAAPPQLLCSLVLQRTAGEVPRGAEPDMITVVCVLVAAFTAVATAVVMCCRCGCCGRREQEEEEQEQHRWLWVTWKVPAPGAPPSPSSYRVLRAACGPGSSDRL